jgi:two-component system cell cycle response regulator DivK
MTPRLTRPRVLIVDDVLTTRVLYRGWLRAAGFDVVEASNGVEALLRVRDALPDVIVMDLMLPLMDGWESTRRLKADSRTARIPVVALSGLTLVGEGATDAGCDAFLTKPCTSTDLVTAIRSVLDRPVTDACLLRSSSAKNSRV